MAIYVPPFIQDRFKGISDFATSLATTYTNRMMKTTDLVNTMLLKKALNPKLKMTEPYVTPEGERAADIINIESGEKVRTIPLPAKKIEPKKYVPTTKEEAIDFEREKEGLKKPYKVGQEITRKEGNDFVTYRISGYKGNEPIYEPISKAPRFKEEGGVPTLTENKSKIFNKWLTDKDLNSKEQKVLRKIFGEKTDDEVLHSIKLKWQGKIKAFEQEFGRKPTDEEKRKMFINDPFGLLGESGASGGGVSDKTINDLVNKYK